MLVVIVLLAILTLILKAKYPSIKGKIGEKRVSLSLLWLPKDQYIVLNDLFFKFGEYSTQIDHIIVSIYGIFVIETKNYKGWIFGNSNKDHWIQNIWGNEYTLYNPIYQNESHIRFLEKNFSEIRDVSDKIYPIVVFLNASRLHLHGECSCVVLKEELMGYIGSYKEKVLGHEQCIKIADTLRTANIQDTKERKQHKAKVREAKQIREAKINQGVCPRCGGQLILREGQFGQFYGCSNFPNCRYTHNPD